MEARPHTLYMDAFIGLETIDGDASVNLRSQLPFFCPVPGQFESS